MFLKFLKWLTGRHVALPVAAIGKSGLSVPAGPIPATVSQFSAAAAPDKVRTRPASTGAARLAIRLRAISLLNTKGRQGRRPHRSAHLPPLPAGRIGAKRSRAPATGPRRIAPVAMPPARIIPFPVHKRRGAVGTVHGRKAA